MPETQTFEPKKAIAERPARNQPVAYADVYSTWLGEGVFGIKYTWRHGPIQTIFQRVFQN